MARPHTRRRRCRRRRCTRLHHSSCETTDNTSADLTAARRPLVNFESFHSGVATLHGPGWPSSVGQWRTSACCVSAAPSMATTLIIAVATASLAQDEAPLRFGKAFGTHMVLISAPQAAQVSMPTCTEAVHEGMPLSTLTAPCICMHGSSGAPCTVHRTLVVNSPSRSDWLAHSRLPRGCASPSADTRACVPFAGVRMGTTSVLSPGRAWSCGWRTHACGKGNGGT